MYFDFRFIKKSIQRRFKLKPDTWNYAGKKLHQATQTSTVVLKQDEQSSDVQ